MRTKSNAATEQNVPSQKLSQFLAVTIVVVAFFAGPLADTAEASDPIHDVTQTYRQGNKAVWFCEQIGVSTMTAPSPLLVMGVGGLYEFVVTPSDKRDNMSLFAHPGVFVTLLVLVVLIACKDVLLTWLGPLKTPLDGLAELLHMLGGVMGIAYLATSAFQSNGASEAGVGNTALALATFLMMVAVHCTVWIVFNIVEVAVILSPFPFVDTCLKSMRVAVIAVIAVLTFIHPVLGFLASLPIILLCVWMAPTAYRLMIVGWVHSWDLLRKIVGAGKVTGPVRAFASWHMPGVAIFTYGKVQRNTGCHLEFVHRRFFFLWSRTIPLPGVEPILSHGTLSPYLFAADGEHVLLRFPPRYGGREIELAQKLSIDKVVDYSLKSSVVRTLHLIRDWLMRRIGRTAEPAT